MSTPATASAFGSRPVLSAARAADAALAGARAGAQAGQLWALSDAEVAEALGHLERVRAGAEAQQVAVVAEARTRGLGSEQGCTGVDWSTSAAPGTSTGHASTLQLVADACRDPRLADLAAGVESGALSLPKAAQLARFQRAAAPVADPEQLVADTATLLQAAPALTEQQLAIAIRHAAALLRPERDAEHLAARQRSARALFTSPGPAGMSSYRLQLDPEGAALLDAAIDPLARPRPAKDDPDLHTPAGRRTDALLTVLGRGVSRPGQAPKTAKAAVVVTMSLEQLTGAVRGAGLTLGQELLTAGTVRRLACDADLIPAVLGTKSELLDVGRRTRLVPPAIRLTAWLRDGGCGYPGCASPRSGATRTTASPGGQAATRPWRTPPCSAGGTTPWSTTAT